jgi:chromosome segregation ATPase
MKLQTTTDTLNEKTEAFEDLQAAHNLLESEKAGLAKDLKERTEEREKALKETAKCMDERDELRSSVDDAEYGRMDAQRRLAAAERCVCSFFQGLRSHRSIAHLTLAYFLCLSLSRCSGRPRSSKRN